MRILHLITRMDGGGSAVNTLLSAIGQLQAGHRVCLGIGPSEESAMSGSEREQLAQRMQRFNDAGGEVVVIHSLVRRPGLSDYRAYREIRTLLARGFDVVHTHTSKAGALGRLAARDGSAVVVHTPHGHIFLGYFGRLMTTAFIIIERWLAHSCDALVALTAAERDDHLACGIGHVSQWRVVPSGVDVTDLAARVDAWREAHAGAQDWDAVSVGRLTPVKGMDRLVRAWAVFCRQRPDARLAIVGDGEQRGRLESMCRELGIAANVHFAGWCDPLPFLSSARSFALLSHNEGMGRAVVEAFAAGLPCVVADVCGLRELVTEDCGVVVDGSDPEAVAAALASDWPASIREACRARAESYSLPVMLDALQQLYRELIAARVNHHAD